VGILNVNNTGKIPIYLRMKREIKTKKKTKGKYKDLICDCPTIKEGASVLAN